MKDFINIGSHPVTMPAESIGGRVLPVNSSGDVDSNSARQSVRDIPNTVPTTTNLQLGVRVMSSVQSGEARPVTRELTARDRIVNCEAMQVSECLGSQFKWNRGG